MIVIDAHLDLAWNALSWNRDLTLTVPEVRASEAGMKERNRGTNTVAFPEMRTGEVAVCLATVLARASGLGEALLDYRSREIACAMAQGQLAYYRIMESEGRLRMLKDWPSLEAHFRNWKTSGSRAICLWHCPKWKSRMCKSRRATTARFISPSAICRRRRLQTGYLSSRNA